MEPTNRGLGSLLRFRRAVGATRLAAVLGALIGIAGVSLSVAAPSSAAGPTLQTVTHVPVQNRQSAALRFSSPPKDEEVLHSELFAEPLVPVSPTSPQENSDLAQSLIAYQKNTRQSGAPDAVSPLLAFLKKHPTSAWKPALQLNLGIIYRQTGHFSKALSVWQEGWAESKSLTSRDGRDVANSIVARLSQLEAYLGRKELLQPLLASIKYRKVGGASAQLLTDSRTGLYEMIHEPGLSFRCGPLALKRILTYRGADPSAHVLRVLDDSSSTDHGLSLSMVERIATKAGMHYQMAFRKPGSAVVVPAVVNWKVGHYAALVAKLGGDYLIEDTTFGSDIRISRRTLDQEGSGYFLVPAGPLPEGWRSVSAGEGSKIWGRGNTGSNHDSGANGPCNCGGAGSGSGNSNGGYTTWNVELEVVGLQLHDQPVGYTPPVGPAVRFDLYYSHRDSEQPATFAYTNFGPKWTFSWLSYVTDSVNTTASALLYQRGGGNEPFSFSSTSSTTSYPGPYSQGTLTRTVSGGGSSTGFTLTFPDGSFEQFDQAVGNQFFMTAVGDPQGNKVTLVYDSQMRIVSITDAIGQVTTLTYGLSGSPLLVTQITDPFGRSAAFTYNASGQLASITDVIGITSSYTYGQGTDPDFVNTLTTPYGSTAFTYGDSTTNSNLGDTRFLKIVDPLSRTTYVEFDQGIDAGDSAGGVLKNSALIPAGMNTIDQYIYWRNTFYFDPNQYALATAGGGLNYADATVYHWLHTSDYTDASRVLESIKKPLENRVWYNYPAQPSPIQLAVTSGGTVANGASNRPTAIGRVLDDGTTQLKTFQYNAQGNVTVATDPVGRQTTYTYAVNGMDVLEIANTTNGGDQVLERLTYNNQHEPLTITGANGRTARYQYNAAGQLTRYTDVTGHVTSVSYDSRGYVQTVQGPVSGDKYTYTHDLLGRIIAVTDPAGSTVHYSYDAADRLTSAAYPDGTSSYGTYNLLDLASYTDRLGQKMQYTYDADREPIESKDPLSNTIQVGYNPAGALDSLTDQNNHTTSWSLDIESRITGKQYADGTSESIAYENSDSLVAQVTDALGQVTTYSYNPDDSLGTVSYAANQPTSGVSFTYDPDYRRVTSMTDGTGTTDYTYYPVASLGANELESVTSPITGASSVDSVTYSYDPLNRVVGMSVDGATQSISYDAISRVTSRSNPLDSFTYSYSDATPRVMGISSSRGPTLAISYYGPQGDELLQQITASSGGTQIDQIGYVYNSDDNVTSLSVSSPTAQTTSYSYDPDNRLLSGLIGSGTPQYQYSYDPASNVTSITANGSTQSYSYGTTNEIESGSYDANGSPTALNGNTYTWDGANRVLSIAGASGTSSTFTYDGLGRPVRVVERNGGNLIADHSYLWCGATLCLAHDNTRSGSPVSTQYFSQGAIISDTPYYYIQDRLGSVREMVAADGSIGAQYDYDPYGNQAVDSGTLASDIAYAGYFTPGGTGLNFTLNRAYDPIDARWLNRDPIEERGGMNLYSYVDGAPLSNIDQFGLSSLIYNTTTGIVTVVNGAGEAVGSFPAGNNAQSGSRGPWPQGAYSYAYHTTHPDDAPNSPYGSYGNWIFNVPGCIGCGVHSGRATSTDRRGRSGVAYATNGCIRTTDAATGLINQLTADGDRLTGLIVTSTPIPTNLPPFDPSVPGGPKPYLPDVP